MTNVVKVRVKRRPDCLDIPLPRYMSDGASGMDLYAAVEEELLVEPGQVVVVPTGLFIAVPEGYEAQVRPRSGLAAKFGIGVLNSPGTIDSDYRGEVKVILINLGHEPFRIKRGDRIAQMVITPVVRAQWVEVEELDVTARNDGGFGHTGV